MFQIWLNMFHIFFSTGYIFFEVPKNGKRDPFIERSIYYTFLITETPKFYKMFTPLNPTSSFTIYTKLMERPGSLQQ